MGRSGALMAAVAAAVLAGLASPALAAREADGPAPPANYDQLVREHLQHSLRDPYSAHVDLRRAPIWATFDAEAGSVTGWTACYAVNAKNGYGGYTGEETYVFVVEDGAVTYSGHSDGRSHTMSRVVEAACSAPAPAPTPAPKAAAPQPANPKISL